MTLHARAQSIYANCATQPPRLQPKTYILSFKTHKLTVFTTVTQPDRKTIADLKQEALSALTADIVASPYVEIDIGLPEVDPEWEVPQVTSVDDFELCKAVKERGRSTGQYEPLSPDATVKQSVLNWESLFIQFKNEQGTPYPFRHYNTVLHDFSDTFLSFRVTQPPTFFRPRHPHCVIPIIRLQEDRCQLRCHYQQWWKRTRTRQSWPQQEKESGKQDPKTHHQTFEHRLPHAERDVRRLVAIIH